MGLERRQTLTLRLLVEVEEGSVGIETVSEGENIHDFVEVLIEDHGRIDYFLSNNLLPEGREGRGVKPLLFWTDVSDIFNDLVGSDCQLCLIA
jgi:methionine synthase I (cobalamin-dependent)